MMDGPWVNKKFEKDLEHEMKSSHDKTVLDVGTCSLHPVHNAFGEGLKSISFPYDQFAHDIYFFFKLSAARREDFILANLCSDLEIRYAHRHVCTRWVSLKRSYVRINEQWNHLCEYFLEFLPKQKNFVKDVRDTARYKSIVNILTREDSLIYINFVIYVAGIMESYLIPMESKSPKIHVMYTNMGELLYKLMSCFVKKSVLLQSNGTRKEACDLGGLDVLPHLMSVHSVEYGTKAKYLIANLEASTNLDRLKLELRSCLVKITSYLQNHLPHQSTFLKDLSCLQPDQRKLSRSPPAIRRVALKIGKVLKNTKFTSLTPEAFADDVMIEYKLYQSESLYEPEPDDPPQSIEDYWYFIGKIKNADGNLKFAKLDSLVKACLSISHGNADPERGFSENKQILDGRETLGEESIVAIRLVRESVKHHGGTLHFPITRRLINLAENAKTAYEESPAVKRAQKIALENTKKVVDENTAHVDNLSKELGEIENQIVEQQNKLDAAHSVLSDGQNALQKSLIGKKVKKDDVVKANALIKMSIENASIAKDKLAELNEKRQKIIEKMKKKQTNKK